MTALMWAARQGNTDVVVLLLDRGACIASKDEVRVQLLRPTPSTHRRCMSGRAFLGQGRTCALWHAWVRR